MRCGTREVIEPSDRRRVVGRVMLAIGIVGALLRAVQYFAGVSLWLDEAALARNIADRSFFSLLDPLRYAQVAPPLFLWGERASILLLGHSERALRLLPFLAGIGTLIVFARLSRLLLPSPAALLSMWMFSLAVPFVFFSADLKPYSVDVLASLIAVTVAWEHAGDNQRDRDAWLIGSLGLLGWLSHATTLVLAGIGASLVMRWMRRRFATRSLVIVALAWAATIGPAAFIAARNLDAVQSSYLQRRWAAAFAPWHPMRWPRWLWATLQDVVAKPSLDVLDGSLHYPWPWLFIGFAAIGLWRLSRVRQTAVWMVSMTVAVTLAVSAAGAYPFTGRFILFLIPFLLLTAAAGVVECGRLARSTTVTVAATTLMATLALVPIVRTPPVQRREDIKPVLSYMQTRPAPDRIYVYYGAAQAVAFYTQDARWAHSSFVIGRCARGNLKIVIDDLAAFRGLPRVWIILSHVGAQRHEAQLVIDYVDAIARRVDAISGRGNDPAVGYSYDFSDDERWARGTAQMPVPPAHPEEAWQCEGPVASDSR
jgi:hypothetical protein